MNKLTEERKAAASLVAVFPCVLKIMPQHIFNKKDPIIMGVEILEGSVRVGTPLTVPATGFVDVGRIIGIENNRKEVQSARNLRLTALHETHKANGAKFFAGKT